MLEPIAYILTGATALIVLALVLLFLVIPVIRWLFVASGSDWLEAKIRVHTRMF
jgi:hypothetical protein